ncbi:MAG: hypothetical protein SGJ09_17960 [Phycisphaerae bacterium]|nr:hypothetical protein [Phycisphaerae bacterium]
MTRRQHTLSVALVAPLAPMLGGPCVISMTTNHPRGSTCVALVLCHASNPDEP